MEIDWSEINEICEKPKISSSGSFISALSPEQREKIKFLRMDVIKVGDTVVYSDSNFPQETFSVICEYLEKKYPELSKKGRYALANAYCYAMK